MVDNYAYGKPSDTLFHCDQEDGTGQQKEELEGEKEEEKAAAKEEEYEIMVRLQTNTSYNYVSGEQQLSPQENDYYNTTLPPTDTAA